MTDNHEMSEVSKFSLGACDHARLGKVGINVSRSGVSGNKRHNGGVGVRLEVKERKNEGHLVWGVEK
jgi:hypothetical protein